jgi:hypothetical protein
MKKLFSLLLMLAAMVEAVTLARAGSWFPASGAIIAALVLCLSLSYHRGARHPPA